MPKKELIQFEGFMPHGPNVPHGIRVGDFLYYSAIRPAKPDGTTDDTPEGQARQAFENLRRLLEGHGATFNDVVKVRVYVTDMSYVRPMNQVWYEHFPMETNPAARIVIGVNGLPGQNTMISLDVTAQVPGA